MQQSRESQPDVLKVSAIDAKVWRFSKRETDLAADGWTPLYVGNLDALSKLALELEEDIPEEPLATRIEEEVVSVNNGTELPQDWYTLYVRGPGYDPRASTSRDVVMYDAPSMPLGEAGYAPHPREAQELSDFPPGQRNEGAW